MPATITYSDGHKTITLTLGRRPGIQREAGDIALSRHPHPGLPICLTLLVRADGKIEEWMAEWEHTNQGGYWHFSHGSPGSQAPTQEQRQAIAQLFFGHPQAFGLGGSVSAPVQHWCRFASLRDLEHLGNAGKHGIYA